MRGPARSAAEWLERLPVVPMGAAVPRILHQNFLAGEAAIPAPMRAVRDALRAANPGWADRFWDAPLAEAFIAEVYGPDVLNRYCRIGPDYYAARSDLLRYLALYRQGGVYLDIKSTCDRPLDTAIRPGDRFLLMHYPHLMQGARTPEADEGLRRNLREIAHLPHGEYVQWVIACVPGHPYLRAVIAQVLANIDAYSPLRFGVGGAGTVRLTGPVAYTLTIEPIRDAHPHDGPMSAADRGFVYSGLPAGTTHQAVFGARTYYQNLAAPIVASSRTMTLAVGVLRFAMRFGPVGAAARRIRAMLARRRIT